MHPSARDAIVNPEKLTAIEWRAQAFVIRGRDLIGVREALVGVLLDLDRKSLAGDQDATLHGKVLVECLRALGAKP